MYDGGYHLIVNNTMLQKSDRAEDSRSTPKKNFAPPSLTSAKSHNKQRSPQTAESTKKHKRHTDTMFMFAKVNLFFLLQKVKYK